jgi:cytochrome P450
LVDHQIDQFIGNGRCEFLSEYAKPFATSAIIDLLGVPEADRPEFLAALGAERPDGNRVGALDGEPVGLDPLKYLDDRFVGYLAERRRAPQDDVLSGMAAAVYPDGSTPELIEVAKPATFLFAAGQETVTKLLSAAVQTLGDRPEYQQMLRENPGRIPTFIEEALRMHSPTKIDFRLVRKTTTLGGMHLPAGTIVMLCLGAANRDPHKFENPHEFWPDRKNVREHIAFGRGIHTCAGAPLARVEGQITIRRLLDRMREIRIDEMNHGPADNRRYAYEPTFLLRGLTELHIEFETSA